MPSTPDYRYILAGGKPWNRHVLEEVIASCPGTWQFVALPEELTLDAVAEFQPRYLFFIHWSWKVPSEIVGDYECVGFHMTDLPYGRGGSPLQNLIVRGHRDTKLTALRMVDKLDAGPVYLKEDLCLEGSAEEIYIRASRLSAKMIRRIIEENLKPTPQTGSRVMFKRRTPEQSRIPKIADLQSLYDFIRMLDAEGYPRAYLEHEGFRYEFRRAAFYDGRILSDVVVSPSEEQQS